MALGSWLSSAWHAAGGPIAAVAAVALGQPELVPAALAAGNAASAKKPPQPQLVAAPTALQPGQAGGFIGAYESLPQVDREIVVVGGAVLGAILLAKVLAPRGRR